MRCGKLENFLLLRFCNWRRFLKEFRNLWRSPLQILQSAATSVNEPLSHIIMVSEVGLTASFFVIKFIHFMERDTKEYKKQIITYF